MMSKMDRTSNRTYLMNSRNMHLLVFCLGLLLSIGLRFYHIDETPHSFWTVRQYSSPTLARAMYLLDNPATPDWMKSVLAEQSATVHRGEPPITEWIAVWLYRLTGHVSFWALRITPVMAWICAGIFLYRLGCRLFSPIVGLFAFLIHQLLPFGLIASRSIQPDSLMVAGMLGAQLLIVRYFQEPKRVRWWVAAIGSGVAIWLKPGLTQLAIAAVYFFLSLQVRGWRSTLKSLHLYGFLALAALPAICHMAYENYAGRGLVSSFLLHDFQPRLLITVFYWKGWAGILTQILGFVGPLLALLGILSALRRTQGGAYLLGCGLAYFSINLITEWGASTHDYRHLQAIPLFALGIGLLMVQVLERLRDRPFLAAGSVVVLAFSMVGSGRQYDLYDPGHQSYIEMCEQIGEKTDHSVHTIFMDYDWGTSLKYFGLIEGRYWPETQVMSGLQQVGVQFPFAQPDLTAEERYHRFYEVDRPDYFVICRVLHELDFQPGLQTFLNENYTVLDQGSRYIIYDLRPENQKNAPVF